MKSEYDFRVEVYESKQERGRQLRGLDRRERPGGPQELDPFTKDYIYIHCR